MYVGVPVIQPKIPRNKGVLRVILDQTDHGIHYSAIKHDYLVLCRTVLKPEFEKA